MESEKIKRSNFKYLLIIIFISLVLHISTFFLFGMGKPLVGDGYQYHVTAISIIKNFSIPTFGPPVNIRTPGYSLFLLPFYLINSSEIVPRILNIAISLLAIYLAYILALKYVDRKRAIAVSLIVGIYPTVIFFATMVISEPLAMVMVLLLQIYLIKKFSKSNKFTFILTGLMIGYLALIKPNLLLFLPVISIYILIKFGFRRSIIPLILLIVFTALVLTPWVVRNYIKFGGIIALSSNGGYLFWCSNNEDLIKIDGAGKYYEYRITDRWKEIEGLSIVERENVCWKRGIQFYTDNPGRGILFLMKKVYRFINPLQIKEGEFYFWDFTMSYKLLRVFNLFFVIFLSVLFILGIITLHNKEAFFILIIPIIVIFLSSIIWWSSYRFRLISEPSIIIIACAGLFGFIDWVKQRNFTHLKKQKAR